MKKINFIDVVKKHKYISLIIVSISILCFVLVFLFRDECEHKEDELVEVDIVDDKDKKNDDYIKVPNRTEELKKAFEKNNETVAWVYIPGTTVDYPVMKGIDNNYYLRRNEEKEYSFEGCIFGDDDSFFSPFNELSNNVVLYGHNLDDNPNGKRFAQLIKFLDAEFAKNTPYIFLTTKDVSLVYEIFAVYFTDIKFGYTRVGLNENMQQKLVDSAKNRSEYIYNVDVTGKDKIITLSTCTYRYGEYGSRNQKNTRFVVQGKLLNNTDRLEKKIDIQKNLNPKAPDIDS